MQPVSLYRRGARLLSRAVRAHPVPFTVAIVGALVFAATAVLATVVLGSITDDVLVPAFDGTGVDTSTVLAAVAVLVGLALIRTVGVVTRRYYAGATAASFQRTLREQLARRFVRMPLADHRRQPTGELLAHADSDVEVTSEFLHPVPFGVAVVALVLFSLLSLALIDVWFLVIGLMVFPALTVLNRAYTSRVERPAADVQRSMGDVASVVHESFAGALVVKTLGRQRLEVDRLARSADDLRTARMDVGRLRARFEPTLDTIPSLGIVALVGVGAWRSSHGEVTPGDIVQSVALFQLLAFPMRVLGYLLEELPRSVVAVDRLDALLDRTSEERNDGGRGLPPGDLTLTVRDLRFGFDGPPVLDGVDLDVGAGEILAVVGSTGAGKSTLCTLLAGLEPPSAGSIELGGVPLGEVDPVERAGAVTLVFQESFLFADTVRENVTLGRDVDDAELADALAVASVDRFVDDLPRGLDTVVGERGVTLSGGQRQRVALARGLIGSPRLLLLDDATSAIDPSVEAEILDGLRRHLRATTVIIAQRPSTIRLADRVAFFRHGQVIAAGPHDELLAIDEYEALVAAYERAAAP